MRSLRLEGRPARLLGAMAAASCLLMQACESEDPVSVSIETASMELRSLNPTGGPGPSASARRERYQAALSELKSPGGTPSAAQQTTIALMTAEAEAGLAIIPLSEAFDIERAVLADIREADALLAEWRSHVLSESTSLMYDPSEELAEIDDEIAQRDADITLAEGVKVAIDDRIRGLTEQIDQNMAEASEQREIEARLRTEARATSAVEGAELIKTARAHQRVADALEVESEKLQARVDQLEREAAEAQLEIDRLRTQRQLLGKARADVQQRAQAASEEAAQAAREADEAASELATVLQRIEQARSSSSAMSEAYDDAFAGLERALSAARRAQGDQKARSAAKTAMGAIQQTLGAAHDARARGIRAHVNLLESLVEEGAELPGSAAHGALLEQARSDLAAEEQAAADAYAAARSDYESAGLRNQEDRDRIERLNSMLTDLAPQASDG